MGKEKGAMEKVVEAVDNWNARQKTLGAISVYFILLLLVFGVVIFGGKTLYPLTHMGRSTEYLTSNQEVLGYINSGGIYADTGASDWVEIPMMSASVRNIHNGQLPLWNNYNSLGMPIIDNNNGSTLAPFAALLYINNTELMWSLMYIMRVFIIMLFTYLFLDEIGLRYGPALIGGVVFGLSGYVMLYLNIFFMHVDALLPMLMWATIRYIKRRSVGRWIVCAIVVAAMSLGGNPQNLITCCMLAVTFYVVCVSKDRIEKKSLIKYLKQVIIYISCYIGGVVLSLGYWLSFLTLYSNCYSYHQNAGLKAKSCIELLGFIIPNGFFNAYDRTKWMPYMGIVVVLTIILQMDWRKESKFYKEKIYFAIFTALFILKIVGFPLLNWIGYLPILNELGFTKYNSCIYFCVAVMAAISLNDMLTGVNIIRVKLQCLVLIILSIIINIIYYSERTNQSILQLQSYLKWISVVVIPLGIMCAVCLRGKQKRLIYCGLFMLFICTELISYPLSRNGILPHRGTAFEEPEFIKELKEVQQNGHDRVFCVGNVLMGNLSAIYGISSVGGISPTPEIHYWNFMNELILNHNIDLQMVTTQSTAFVPESIRYLNMLGVKFFLVDNEGELDDSALTPVYDSGKLKIYKNETAFEKAYTVHSIISVGNEEEALEKMRSDNFNFRQMAVVENGAAFCGLLGENKNKDIVEMVDYQANSVLIKCKMDANGLLVLSDLYYPGWEVYVNGERKELLRTNDIIRGVYVEAGDNFVEFVYRPRAFIIGSLISVGFICILVIFIISRKVRKGEFLWKRM